MVTRHCKLQDPVKVQETVDNYFRKREEEQEVRELKNGDKRVYREPPSKYRLCKALGIDADTFDRYTNSEYTGDRESYNKEICGILTDARQRIIDELTEGVLLGYWNDRVCAAMLTKFGVIGSEEQNRTVTINIQGNESWSE